MITMTCAFVPVPGLKAWLRYVCTLPSTALVPPYSHRCVTELATEPRYDATVAGNGPEGGTRSNGPRWLPMCAPPDNASGNVAAEAAATAVGAGKNLTATSTAVV